MIRFRGIRTFAIASAMLAMVWNATAQAPQSQLGYFASRNIEVAKVQPGWAVPVISPFPGLVQYYRFAATRSITSEKTLTWNYGSGRGGGLIEGNRWELGVCPGAYLQHNTRSVDDGFSDLSIYSKYRILSAPDNRGNYMVTALLTHTFATGSAKNGARTDSYTPTLEAGKGWRHYDIQTTLGGTLPTGKIAAQGRTINWNATLQDHVAGKLWLAIENNATFYFSGTHDGKEQNFVTPEIIVSRLAPREWIAKRRYFILATGMQFATSSYHATDHNLILDARVLF